MHAAGVKLCAKATAVANDGLPHNVHVVSGQRSGATDQGGAFASTLSEQQPIEGIPMVSWERMYFQGVVHAHRQYLEIIPLHLIRDELRRGSGQLKPSQGGLDGDLPAAGSTEEQAMPGLVIAS